MDPNAIADAKAKIKRMLREQLAELPLQARADVLADLRLELADADDAGPEKKKPRKVRRVPRGFTKGTKVNGATPARRDDGGPTAKTFAALKAHPRMPLDDLMKTVYPDDTSGSTAKVRAVLFSLQKQGRAKNVGHGKWEAIAE